MGTEQVVEAIPLSIDMLANDQIKMTSQRNRRSLLSVVTPAYSEEHNLPVLYQRLCKVLDALDLDWEWVVVDDHSLDSSFAVVAEIARRDARVRVVRFARNVGSHRAITCGLHRARGDCAVVMAADLQDPPEILPQLVAAWDAEVQVVWAVRGRREGESPSTIAFSRLYYFIMRHIVGIKEMTPTGADFFLIDRVVIEALRLFNESNVDVMALITWMGFRQTAITYDKEARLHGSSGWTLEKKLKLVVDSVTSFTYLPLRLMSYSGFIVALFGFAYAVVVIVNALTGNLVQGWSSLMVVTLIIGGIQMLMMGVLGEYLWRVLDESRRRPQYLIEAAMDAHVDLGPVAHSCPSPLLQKHPIPSAADNPIASNRST